MLKKRRGVGTRDERLNRAAELSWAFPELTRRSH